MTNWDAIVRKARECHTKMAWQAIFDAHGDALTFTTHSKPIQDLYKLLRADPQSLQYDPRLWAALIKGSLCAWNLELAREIASFIERIPSPIVCIPAVQAYLESGHPATARQIVNRTLRLTGISPAERLQLELLVTRSYTEEGQRQKSLRLLAKVLETTPLPDLSLKQRADILTDMARIQFFLGRYLQGGELFHEASRLYFTLEDWDAAAKTTFNTAACHLNDGRKNRRKAFSLIEECRHLAQRYGLQGPLSHCEAAYGIDAYQHGNFPAALAHLRRALSYLPTADNSYRRLHVLSMLSYTYLAMGRYHLAKKFGLQTFNLAALDESDRNKTRYLALKAELLWEEGNLDKSQSLLLKACQTTEVRGVHTLEDLSTLNRLNIQSAYLGITGEAIRPIIDESLKKNQDTWLSRMYGLGQIHLNQNDFENAESRFRECQRKAREIENPYHAALGTLGLIHSKLKRRNFEQFDSLLYDFESQVAHLGDSPLKAQTLFVLSARAYQMGDFTECGRLLKLAEKVPRVSFSDRFVLLGWLATTQGRSFRMTGQSQIQLMARYTKTYFAPTLEALDRHTFQVSGHYTVSLDRHPALATLLHHLLSKSSFSATTDEIQTQVWKQSLALQGWQQKIRNTIMRLRDFFPQTMAPLILHDETISLFRDAITLSRPRQGGLGSAAEIRDLLQEEPMSSRELAKQLNISPATTKRILRKLAEDRIVSPIKKGRNIYYTSFPNETAS